MVNVMIPRPINVDLSYRFLELLKESVLGNASLSRNQSRVRSVTYLFHFNSTSESKINSNRTLRCCFPSWFQSPTLPIPIIISTIHLHFFSLEALPSCTTSNRPTQTLKPSSQSLISTAFDSFETKNHDLPAIQRTEKRPKTPKRARN